MKKGRFTVFAAALAVILLLIPLAMPAHAADLDEIVDYVVTVNVNDDATLDIVYEIDWKVLDSDSEGPLTWVMIGIPNDHYVSYEALSETVKDISYDGNSFIRIDFDRAYYENETVSFSFRVVQDYMYQMDYLTSGETVYEFTPGWFDNANVDRLLIRWMPDKIFSISPACTVGADGYKEWEKTGLGHGDKLTVSVTYKNDAFGFDPGKTIEKIDDYDYNYGDSNTDAFDVLGGMMVLGLFILPIIISVVRSAKRYGGSSGFTNATEKKITRTKIEYYPQCQGCGAPREEGKDTCEYCGRSMIKSEEKIEENDIPKEETEIRNKRTNGTYRYSSSPDTYVRVNVINVPVRRSYSSSSSSSSRSSSSHSSCAHSSCACACACAGGGRAGCTSKDYYNTELKLRYLEYKKR